MDFTLQKYTELLQALKEYPFRFFTFEYYCAHKSELDKEHFIILRHDVDLKAENSLETAKIEHSLGILASYYFREVEQSNKPEIIKNQLAYFRQFYLVKTICMHGAPRSKYDGRDLWKRFDYHDYGVIGEPYFDVDFSKVFYLTDTGRRWDGFNVSVRDKVPVYQDEWIRQGLIYHYTEDILKALERKSFPKQLMMTTHPQRWTNSTCPWLKELCCQSVKNVAKGLLVKLS